MESCQPCLFEDPHNHSPEVSPGDEWSDAKALHPRASGTAAVLPLKRAQVISPNSTSPEPEESDPSPSGMRIGVSRPSESPVPDVLHSDIVRLRPGEAEESIRIPAKQTFQPRAATHRKHATDRDWGVAHKISLRWFAYASIGMCSLVVAGFLILQAVNKNQANRKASSFEIDNTAAKPMDARIENLLTREFDAEQLFRAYGSAPIVDDFLPLVRDADQLEALIRSRHRSPGLPKDWIPNSKARWIINDGDDNSLFGTLNGFLPDFTPYCAYAVLDENNALLLDWKATTAYGTAEFQELAAGKGDASEIRARIQPGAFFTLACPEEKYDCFKTISPDNNSFIWSYSPKGSATAGKLHHLLPSGEILQLKPGPTSLVKVTLRLERGADGTLPNQWLLESLLHKDWLNP